MTMQENRNAQLRMQVADLDRQVTALDRRVNNALAACAELLAEVRRARARTSAPRRLVRGDRPR